MQPYSDHPKQPRRVRFFPYVTARNVPSLKKWHASLWLSEKEFSYQLERDLQLVRMMQDGSIPTFDHEDLVAANVSLRGLEGRTKAGLQVKKDARSKAYHAVIDAQDVVDPQTLASFYQVHSLVDQKRAHEIALQDAAWVQQQQSRRRVQKRCMMEKPLSSRALDNAERHAVAPTAA